MSRRHARRWMLPIVLWASSCHEGIAQSVPLPPALDERPSPTIRPDGPGEPDAENFSLPPPPPAPRPIPGPVGAGMMGDPVPRGVPINLATAMQFAGARPLDIAAATRQV